MVRMALDKAVLGSHEDAGDDTRHGGRTRTIPRHELAEDVLLVPPEGGLGEEPGKHFDPILVPQRRWSPFQWLHPRRLLPLRHGQN